MRGGQRGEGSGGAGAGVGRREFLRRGAMTAVAAAAAGWLGRGIWPRAAWGAGPIPPLNAQGRVTGVAGRADLLVAVGERAGGPAAWTYAPGDESWVQAADASAFPDGAALLGITALGGSLLAAGAVTALQATSTVYDEEGRPVQVEIHARAPAVFASTDGAEWVPELGGLAGTGGILTAIATVGEGSGALAIGSEFLEPDLFEAYGLLAFASDDGDSWKRVDVPGVRLPAHGDVTLLADVGGQLLAGTNGFESTALYRGPDPWEPVEPPEVPGPASFVAAGPIGANVLLAGIDHLDDVRYWLGVPTAWKEVGPPAGVPGAARLAGLSLVDGSLVGFGSVGDRALVASVGA